MNIKSAIDAEVLPSGNTIAALNKKNYFRFVKRFVGWGATEKKSFLIPDVNDDGKYVVHLSAPKGLECIVRDGSGDVLLSSSGATALNQILVSNSQEISYQFRVTNV